MVLWEGHMRVGPQVPMTVMQGAPSARNAGVSVTLSVCDAHASEAPNAHNAHVNGTQSAHDVSMNGAWSACDTSAA